MPLMPVVQRSYLSLRSVVGAVCPWAVAVAYSRSGAVSKEHYLVLSVRKERPLASNGENSLLNPVLPTLQTHGLLPIEDWVVLSQL